MPNPFSNLAGLEMEVEDHGFDNPDDTWETVDKHLGDKALKSTHEYHRVHFRALWAQPTQPPGPRVPHKHPTCCMHQAR